MAKSKKSVKSTKATKGAEVKTSKVVARKPAKKAKKVTLKNFKVSKEPLPFMTFKVTEQTLYWFVMLSLIFCLALWILNIQLKTTAIIDTINAL
jgi:hypothetical protein